MKKTITALAAFTMITASAAMAVAGESIDPMGKANVSIAPPAVQTATVEAAVLKFDSNGAFTAAATADTAGASVRVANAADKSFCLDTFCRADMKL